MTAPWESIAPAARPACDECAVLREERDGWRMLAERAQGELDAALVRQAAMAAAIDRLRGRLEAFAAAVGAANGGVS